MYHDMVNSFVFLVLIQYCSSLILSSVSLQNKDEELRKANSEGKHICDFIHFCIIDNHFIFFLFYIFSFYFHFISLATSQPSVLFNNICSYFQKKKVVSQHLCITNLKFTNMFLLHNQSELQW